MSSKGNRLSLADFEPRTVDFEVVSPTSESKVVGIKLLTDTEFDALMKSVPDPEPPYLFSKNKETGAVKKVADRDDPGYKAAVAEAGRERTYRLLAAAVDIPFPGDTFAQKAKSMRETGIPSWLLLKLARAVYSMMGLETAEVEQRAETFR